MISIPIEVGKPAIKYHWLLLASVWLTVTVFVIAVGDINSAIICALSGVAIPIAIPLPRRMLAVSLIVTSGIVSAIAFTQWMLGLPPIAMTGNINLVGYIAAIGCLVSVRFPNSILPIAFFLTIIISGCAGALLVLAVALAIEHKHDRRFIVFAVFMSIGVIVANGGRSIISRLMIYNHALRSNVSLIGSADVLYWAGVTHSHNLVLQSIVGLGIAPTIAISGLVGFFLSRVRLSGDVIAFLAVTSAIDYIYWWPGVLAFVLIFVAHGMQYEYQ
jgi:hypothetical protein